MLEDRLALAVVQWVGGSGDWNTGSNWSNGVGPGAADDAVIDVAGTIAVTHSSGTHTVRSLLANDQFTLSGGTLNITTDFSGAGPLAMSGGTLQNATLASGTTLRISSQSENVLDHLAIDGTLDMATNNSRIVIQNGLSLNGIVNVGNAAASTSGSFNLQGASPLTGTGTLVIGGSGSNYVGCRFNGETTTIGAGVTVRGSRGQIGFSGCSLINLGTIMADPGVGLDAHFGPGGGVSTGNITVAGGSLNLFESWNAGATTLTAGSLNLGSTFTTANLGTFTRGAGGTAGTVNVIGTLNGGLTLDDATGTWILAGGTLSGGTLSVAAGSASRLRADGNNNNLFTNVVINDGLDLESITNTRLRVNSGSTLNQTVQVGDAAGARQGILWVIGSTPLAGTGTVVLGGNNSNYFGCFSAGETTTIGPGITVRGKTGDVGNAGSCSLVNQGTIAADTAGGTFRVHFGSGGGVSTGHLQISGGTMQLDGVWNAADTTLTAGSLNLGGTFTQASLGTFTRGGGGTAGTVNVIGTLNGGLTLSDATGSWNLAGGTLSGGTLSVAAGSASRLRADGNNGNLFTNVVVNDGLDLESITNTRLRVNSGSTLNQTVQVGDAAGARQGILWVTGSTPLAGTGTVVLGGNNSNYFGCFSAGETTTIGPGITVRGKTGDVGNAGSCSFVNQGTIAADTAGGTFRVHFGSGGGVSTGHLQISGGTMQLDGVWNAADTTLTAGSLNLGSTFTTANLGTFTRGAGGTAGTVNVIGTLNGGLTLDDATGTWILAGGTLSGGTLSVAAGSASRLRVDGNNNNLFTNVVINDGLDLESITNTRLRVNSGSTLNQTVQVGDAAGARQGILWVTGSTPLAGTGTVVLGGHNSNYFGCYSFGETTTIGPGISVRGKTGDVGNAGSCSFVNQGTIAADTAGGTFRVHFGSGGGVSTGHLQISGGTMSVDGALNAGATTLAGGTLNLSGTFSQAGLGTFTRGGAGTAGIVNVFGTLNGGLALSNGTGSWNLTGGALSGGTLSVAAGSSSRLIIDGNTNNAISNVVINSGLDMDSINLATLTLSAGATLNQSLQLGDVAGSRAGRLWVASELEGNGGVVFGGNGINSVSCRNNFTTTTIGSGIRIQGKSGTVGSGLCALTNHGSISADVAGGTFHVNFGSGSANSNGHLSISGGTLNLHGAWDADGVNLTSGNLVLDGTFTQSNLGVFTRAQNGTAGTVSLVQGGTLSGGLLLDNTTGSWYLSGGTLSGGTLAVAQGSDARLIVSDSTNNTLSNVTVAGGLSMDSTLFTFPITLTMTAGSTLNQSLQVGDVAGTKSSRLWLVGGETLAGTGEVVFGGAGTNSLSCRQFTAPTFTIGTGITVRGKAGTIGAGFCTLVNQGAIVADGGGTLSVENPSNFASGTLTGGIWKSVGPSTLRINGANITTNAASITLDGAAARVTRDLGGTSALTSLATVAPGSTFAIRNGANFTTAGSLENQGTLMVGPSSTLTVNGTLTEGNAASLGIEIGGTPASNQFGHVVASGAATLGGSLDVTLANGYGPAPPQSYVPITYASKSGDFSTVQVPLFGGNPALGVNVAAASVTLSSLLDSPDLTLMNVVAPASANLGDFVNIVYSVQNRSTTPASAPWTDSVYLSTDGILDAGDLLLGGVTHATAVPPNGSYSATLTAPIPTINLGDYRVIVVADSGLEVPDVARTNNTLVTPGTIHVSIESHPLVFGQRVQAAIESRYSVDHWTFTAVQNQQIRFDLLGSAANAAKFTLRGPAGYVGFSDLTADSPLLTLPTSGSYTLEVRSANGIDSGAYSFQVNETSQTLLTLGTTYNGSIPGSGSAQLFRLDLTDSAPLLIHFDGGTNSDRIEIFAKSGSAPNRQSFDLRNGSEGADHTLAVPLGVPGPMFILVYGDQVPVPSNFSLRVDTTPLTLSSVTPSSVTRGPSSALTIRGLGLRPGSTVELIPVGGGTTISSDFVSVDSTSQLTAYFNLSQAVIGSYDVRVSVPGGMNHTLSGSLAVTHGTPQLETRLILPSALGRHGTATLFVEYANVGTASMAAPILTLQSDDPDNSDRPFMTLDSTRLVAGFWTSALPDGFDTSVQFLASGASPGVLQPGERLRMPVYYAGLQQPWDFTDTQIEFAVSVHEAGDPRTIDWPALSASLRPDYISAGTWPAIYANLQAQIGTTWGDYARTMSENATYLGRLGQSVSDIGKLLDFEIRQAAGLDPIGVLETVTDANVPTPGLSLEFARSFGNTISERYQDGPFGRGWTSNWQRFLEIRADGTLVVHDSAVAQRRFQPDSRQIGAYFSQLGDTGRMRKVAGGAFELTESNGFLTRYFADGKVERQRDTNGNSISAGYTSNRLTTLTHSSGASLTIVYNAAGHIDSITDSLGRVTTYGYDATDLHLTSATSPAGTTTYAYSIGQGAEREHALTSIDDPSGATTSFEYDTRGRLIATSLEGNVQRTTFTYGTAGEVVITNASGVPSKLYFDGNGFLARSEDATGFYVTAQYDNAFRVGGTADATGRTGSTGYTTSGAIHSLTDALGQTTTFVPNGPFNQSTSFTDARGSETRYTYDATGNLTSTIYADATVERATYDAQGNLDVTTNRRGQTLDRTVNSAGQVTREVRSDGTTVDYTYDAHRRLATATDASGTTTLSYDTADRLTRVTYPNGRFLQYTYDAAGRRTRLEDQSGFAVQYTYDAAGRLTTLRNASNALIQQYTYDPAGRVAREDKGNGTSSEYTYDANERITRIVHRVPGGATSAQLDYTYDVAGRMATMSTPDGTWAYTYDLTDQLVRAQFASTNGTIPNQDLNYEYDALGNRVRTVLNGSATLYVANSLNQYSSAGSTTFSYDADGNLTQETGPGGTKQYTYDLLNRLVRVQTPQGVWTYEYDVLGNRQAVVANGQRTEYLVDPTGLGDVTAEYNAAGTLAAHYTQGLSLTSRVDSSGVSSYYNFDSLGSSVQLTGATGAVQNTYGYTPFGDLLVNTGSATNPFTFVGADGVMNDGNGLYFMRARMYSPGLGRFVQQDPIRLAAGDFNLQRYVGNNPTTQVDPSGLVNRGGPNDIQACIASGGKFAYRRDGSGRCEFPPPRPSPPGGYCLVSSSTRTVPGESRLVPCVPRPPDPPPPPPKPPQPPRCLGPYCFSGGGGGAAGSVDPNEKLGAAGFGPQAFIDADAVIPYSVHFENLGPGSIPTPIHPATAPAQRIEVTDQLSTNLDWSTFEFTEFGFGDHTVPVSGLPDYQFVSIPVTQNGQSFNVEVELTFDAVTGQVRVVFQAIDPLTFLPPDVLTGILPPEDGSGNGKGYFNYRVRPVGGLPTGTEIRNIALIKFDINPIIATNQINPEDPAAGTDPNREALNTIDAGNPVSRVNALPATSPANIPVSWGGNDDAGGSGIARYDIYMSLDGGTFGLWLDDTAATSAIFPGIANHHYAFYSVATDQVGHTEIKNPVAEATTLTVANSYPGDFNGDGRFDCADINSLVAAIASGNGSLSFDLTNDQMLTVADVEAWLALAGAANLPTGNPYLPGDANLDGVVDGSDFGIWNSHKFTSSAAWCDGDFNADGVVDGSDFGIWNAHKFQGSLGTRGDFDGDGFFACPDIDLLSTAVAGGVPFVRFDVNNDQQVNIQDIYAWLALAGSRNLPSGGAYPLGDANLDGAVDGSDFGIWNANKFTLNAAWCSGDFNANGSIDGSDFGTWNANKFTTADDSAGVLDGIYADLADLVDSSQPRSSNGQAVSNKDHLQRVASSSVIQTTVTRAGSRRPDSGASFVGQGAGVPRSSDGPPRPRKSGTALALNQVPRPNLEVTQPRGRKPGRLEAALDELFAHHHHDP